MVARVGDLKDKGGCARILLILCVIGSFLPACEGEGVTEPARDEPFVYLVLNERSISHYGDPSLLSQHALLVTSGVPTESPRYREAQRFEMRAISDRRGFDWRRYDGLLADPGTYSGISMKYANFYLSETASIRGMGAKDLRAGDGYELYIETDGRVIRGATRIPESFIVSLQEHQGRLTAVWPQVKGAAGYRISLSDGASEIRVDTTLMIPDALRAGGLLTVYALDENLYRYTMSDGVGRAGIDGGYGVLGAVSVARVEWRHSQSGRP